MLGGTANTTEQKRLRMLDVCKMRVGLQWQTSCGTLSKLLNDSRCSQNVLPSPFFTLEQRAVSPASDFGHSILTKRCCVHQWPHDYQLSPGSLPASVAQQLQDLGQVMLSGSLLQNRDHTSTPLPGLVAWKHLQWQPAYSTCCEYILLWLSSCGPKGSNGCCNLQGFRFLFQVHENW